jgi:hypothetical protein
MKQRDIKSPWEVLIMVEKANSKLGNLTFEEIASELSNNEQLRAAVLKHLAKDHAKEFLSLINVNAGLLHQMSAKFIASDKEWQE